MQEIGSDGSDGSEMCWITWICIGLSMDVTVVHQEHRETYYIWVYRLQIRTGRMNE